MIHSHSILAGYGLGYLGSGEWKLPFSSVNVPPHSEIEKQIFQTGFASLKRKQELIHHIHKWPPCNFEKFKMSATKKRIKYQKRLCQNESLCVVSFDEKLLAFEFWLKHESEASEATL